MRKRFFSLLLAVCLICAPVPVVFAEEFIPVTGEEMLENIMLGINIGNTLDATAYDMETGEYWMDTHTLETETIWGEVKIEQWHFQTIAQKGYTAVRIPVSWTGHTDENYIIDGEWMAHVRQAVDWALEEGLYVILNTHHEWETLYHFMGANADAEDYGEAKRWLTVIWEQIAGEFKDYSERLIFEPMNEPRPDGGWLGDAYSPASEILRMCGITGKLNADALDTIRQSGGNNAKRVVMLAVPQANAAWLKHMTTPGDPYIMMGVFLYPSGDDPKEQSDLELAAIKEAIDGGLPVMVKETAPIGERYTGEVRLDWVRHIHQALAGMGVPSFWWNTAGTEDSLFVRLNGEWIHKDWQDAVFAAYGKTPGPDAPLRSPFPYELSVDQKDGEFTFWQVPERVREAADKLVVECSEPLTGGYAFTKFSSDWVQFDNGDERVTEADDGTLTFDFRGLEGINIGFATWGEGDAAKITRAYIDTWEGTVPAEEPPPPAGTPSAWAADDVARAVGAGFVPEELQSAYEDSITRAEFCALAVGIYETYTGAEITERETFNDTGDVNVQKMAGLGVVSGNGGTFDPDGVFNRQMAARLLTNLLGAMDIHLKKAPVTFPDADSIADWALESVGQVQAAGLISGTGEGLFNPSGKFTRQSGIILMLNVWDYLQNLPEVAELPDLTPTEYTLDKTVLQNSLVSVGDASRFAKAFMKAAGGEAVTVAVIGGSITEGSNAADRAKQSYGPLVVEWMKEKFNNEDITLINAGESGTPSKLGVMRVQKQVLDAKPDIVFVEFAVNDGGDADSNIAYESLVRKILNSESEPAVALLFMMQETGTSNQANMQKTGTHYNLPMVSVKDSIYAEIKAGRMAWEDYSNDYVHPTGEGHAMVAELTEYCLEAVYGQARGLPPDAPYTVPEETVFGSKYEDIVFYTAGNFEPSQVGSFTGSVNDTKPLWNDGWKRLPNSGNSAFVCEVTGREVYLVYWATPGYGNPPGGKLDVSVNGGAAKTVNGGTSWGSPLHTNLWSGGTAETLTISMKMQEGSEANPFWILGIAVVP